MFHNYYFFSILSLKVNSASKDPDMSFPNPYQTEANGELTTTVRKRIHAVRDQLGYSWADLGAEFGFSNTFVHNISNNENPHRIRSKHIEGLIQSLEGLEVKAGIRKVAPVENEPATSTVADLSLEELVNAIAAKGFSVTISPKSA